MSKKLTEEDLKMSVPDFLKKLRSEGGKARAKKLTSKKRSDIAKKAAQARWGNDAKKNNEK